MINLMNNKSGNFYTEGFDLQVVEPFTITVSNGSLYYIDSEKNVIVTDYTNFEFDVVPSNVPAIYDVYLMEDGTIEVDCTEMADDIVAYYNGTGQVKHTIVTFLVPPNAASLQDVQINLNNVVMVNEDTGQ